MKLYRIAFRNVRRHRVRSLLSGSAISIAALSIVMLFALLAGMLDDMENNIKTYASGDVRIRTALYEADEMIDPMSAPVLGAGALLDQIDAMEEVEVAVPRITLNTVFQSDGVDHVALTTAVDFDRELEFQQLDEFLLGIDGGQLPEAGSSEMVMTRRIAEDIGLVEQTGDRFDKKNGAGYRYTGENRKATAYFMMNSGMQAKTLELAEIVHFPVGSLNGPALMMPIDTARKNLRRGDLASEILIRLKKGSDAELFTEKLEAMLAEQGRDELKVTPWFEVNTLVSLFAMAEVSYGVIAAVFFLLGSVVIVNTTIMVILERMKEIGTLGAMGLEGKQLVQLFFLEALYIGIAGSFIGVMLGIIFSVVLGVIGMDMGGAMEGVDLGVSTVIYPRLTWFSVVGVFFYSVIVAATATFIPSLRAGRIKPVEALRSI